MNSRWLCWILIGVLSVACFGRVAAQATEGLDVNQPGFKLGAGHTDVRAMVYRLCAALGIVLVLGGVAIYLLRVVVPKLGPVRKKRVKVAEVHYLGGRKMVHLIEVGHRQLLVGSTPTHISILADVTQHWDEAEELALSAEVGDKS
jgi:flagellar biogenesis protein FliO